MKRTFVVMMSVVLMAGTVWADHMEDSSPTVEELEGALSEGRDNDKKDLLEARKYTVFFDEPGRFKLEVEGMGSFEKDFEEVVKSATVVVLVKRRDGLRTVHFNVRVGRLAVGSSVDYEEAGAKFGQVGVKDGVFSMRQAKTKDMNDPVFSLKLSRVDG